MSENNEQIANSVLAEITKTEGIKAINLSKDERGKFITWLEQEITSEQDIITDIDNLENSSTRMEEIREIKRANIQAFETCVTYLRSLPE